MIQVFNCWLKDIYLPMSALVEYRGYRLIGEIFLQENELTFIAISTLPITNSTLIYGTSNASNEDYLVTQRLKEAGEILDIDVIDHIIIGHNDYYSFKRERKL